MCVIYIAFRADPRYRLVVAANRDEFHDRPAWPLQAWADAPGILAGRDLRGGGTWMGVHEEGRFAALTNFREPEPPPENARSRGELVTRYLIEGTDPAAWLGRIEPEGRSFAGFSLFASDFRSLAHLSNRAPGVRRLGPGTYAISNGLLSDPWPKVVRGLAAFERAIGETDGEALTERLLVLLRDDAMAPDEALPRTGVGSERERQLSPIFIRGTDYGTRSSSVIRVDEDGLLESIEQTYGPDGVAGDRAREARRIALH